MNNDGVRGSLAAHPFLAGVAPQVVDRLAEIARFERFASDSWLVRQGRPADQFHLVVEGCGAIEVSAVGRDPLVIATVHAGEVLGWSWMFPPHEWHFDVLATEHTKTIAVDAVALRTLCTADHELGFEIIQRLAGVVVARLEATRLQLIDVYGHDR